MPSFYLSIQRNGLHVPPDDDDDDDDSQGIHNNKRTHGRQEHDIKGKSRLTLMDLAEFDQLAGPDPWDVPRGSREELVDIFGTRDPQMR